MQKIESINELHLIDILLGIIANKPKHTEKIAEVKLYSALQKVCVNGSREILEKLVREIDTGIRSESDFIYSVTRRYLEGSREKDGIYLKLNPDQIMAINDTILGLYSENVVLKIKEVSKKVWDEYSRLN